jgi:hypothetical protein
MLKRQEHPLDFSQSSLGFLLCEAGKLPTEHDVVVVSREHQSLTSSFDLRNTTFARDQLQNCNLKEQLDLLVREHNADLNNPGQFTVFAPEFRRARNAAGPTTWKVVSADFEHQLVNRWMKPSIIPRTLFGSVVA